MPYMIILSFKHEKDPSLFYFMLWLNVIMRKMGGKDWLFTFGHGALGPHEEPMNLNV